MAFLTRSSTALAILGVVAVAFGVFAVYLASHGKGIPERSALCKAAGTLAWVKSSKFNVKFGLAGDQRSYSYLSKAKAMGAVRDALSRPDHSVVEVLFDEHLDERFDPSCVCCPVYEVRVDGKPVRAYEEVRAAWDADNELGVRLGAVFIAFGVLVVIISAWRRT